jgi:acyl-CoA synthetase (AMP-forming)/AMP-acid ligase II
VTLLDGDAIEGDSLKRAIEGKVAYDLAPLIVYIVAELPMTPTGKIAKAELAARWSAAK